MVKKRSFNQLQQFLISTILLSSKGANAVQISQQSALSAESESQLKLEMTQELMNEAMQHVLQSQNISEDKISDDQLNQGIHNFLNEANLTQMMLDKQGAGSKQQTEQELIQTQSNINNQALSEIKETLIQLKCAVGENCVYSDKKNLVKGKMNAGAKKKIVASKSVPAPAKAVAKGKALAQKKAAVKTPAKAKSVPPKAAKKPVAAKKAAPPKKKALAQVKTPPKAEAAPIKAKAAVTGAKHPVAKAKAAPAKKASTGKKPKVKENIQVEQQGVPYRMTKGNLMQDNDIQNPIDGMMKNVEGKTVKMGNVHVEGDNGSEVGFSSHKNFNLIYNSMDHGKDITHHDLDAERREQGDNLKAMGSMSQKAGEVKKGGDFKKGDLNAQHDVQLEEDQVEVPAEAEAEQPENEKLLKKIDIDGMFKKYSPKKQEKPKIDVKALQKKIAKKVVKAQNEIDKNKQKVKDKVTLTSTEEAKAEEPAAVAEQQQEQQEQTQPAAEGEQVADENATQVEQQQVEQDQTAEATEAPQPVEEAKQAPAAAPKKQVKAKALAQKKATPQPKEAPKPAAAKKEAVKKPQAPAAKVAAKKKEEKKAQPKAKAPEQDVKQAAENLAETQQCSPVDNKLSKQGHGFQIQAQDENSQPTGEKIEFNILPKNLRDSVVAKEVQVLNSEKIIGYTALGGGSTSDKMSQMMEDSDYYNVTVNLIVKRDSEFSVKQKNKESQMVQQEVEETPAASVQVEQAAKENGEQKEDAQSQLEMAAALSSPQEVKEELAEQESYTSKIAKNQAESEAPQPEAEPQPQQPAAEAAEGSTEVPADQVNAQLTNEMDQAIQAAEQSSNKQQLLSEKPEMSEEKGVAVMSFDAAASIGQYTGDMPTDTSEEQFAHYKGITPDQAIALAEKHHDLTNNNEEQNVQLDSQLSRYYSREDVENDENGNEFVEYIVPSDQTILIENAFDNKEEQKSEHEKFMKRVQQKEADTIAKQSNKVKTHPQVPFNLAQQLSEVQVDTEEGQPAQTKVIKQQHKISADDFDGEAMPEDPPVEKPVEEKKATVAAKDAKKDQMSLETLQDNISPPDVDENAYDEEKMAKKKQKEKEEQEVKEREKAEKKKIMDELKEKQEELEHHIQTDLMELAEVVNKRYGDNEHKFDYQLVRISDTRPKPDWQGPIDSADNDEEKDADEDQSSEEDQEERPTTEPESGGDESIKDHYPTPEEENENYRKQKAALRKQKREQEKKEKQQARKEKQQAKRERQQIKKELEQERKEKEQDEEERRQAEEKDREKERRRAKKQKEREEQEENERLEDELNPDDEEDEDDEERRREANRTGRIKEKDFPKKEKKVKGGKDDNGNKSKQSKGMKIKKGDKNKKEKKEEKNAQQSSKSDMNVKDLFQKEFKRVGLSQQQQQLIDKENKQNQIDKKLRKEFKKFEQQAIMAANNDVNTDDSTLKNAEESQRAQAEVDAAQELKEKAKSEASAEEKARQELKEQAELLAQADLKAKQKIKEAALMAAEAQKQNALDVQKKLQEEADAWMKKNKQLIEQQEAAKKAQKEAQEAIEAEKKEREILEKEKKEREAIEKEEKAKAAAKVKIISKIAKRTSKKAQKLQTLLKSKKKKPASIKESHVRDTGDNAAHNDKDEKPETKKVAPAAKETAADKKFINDIVEKASKLKSTKPYVAPVSVAQQQEQPAYHIEELEKEQPYEKAIKPTEPAAKEEKKVHHHKKEAAAPPAATPAVKKEEAAPRPKNQMQPQSKLQKEQQDPELAKKATAAYNKKMSDLQDKEQDEQMRAVVDASAKDADNGEDTEASQTQSDIHLEQSLAQKEQQAISQVSAAQKEGEAKGRAAAAKMIAQQKTQTPKQNAAQVEELRNKLTTTSQQVNAIINNFQKVHEEMKELKQEYVQSMEEQQAEAEEAEDSEVQLSSKLRSSQQSKSKSHLQKLDHLLQKQEGLKLKGVKNNNVIKNKK